MFLNYIYFMFCGGEPRSLLAASTACPVLTKGKHPIGHWWRSRESGASQSGPKRGAFPWNIKIAIFSSSSLVSSGPPPSGLAWFPGPQAEGKAYIVTFSSFLHGLPLAPECRLMVAMPNPCADWRMGHTASWPGCCHLQISFSWDYLVMDCRKHWPPSWSQGTSQPPEDKCCPQILHLPFSPMGTAKQLATHNNPGR